MSFADLVWDRVQSGLLTGPSGIRFLDLWATGDRPTRLDLWNYVLGLR